MASTDHPLFEAVRMGHGHSASLSVRIYERSIALSEKQAELSALNAELALIEAGLLGLISSDAKARGLTNDRLRAAALKLDLAAHPRAQQLVEQIAAHSAAIVEAQLYIDQLQRDYKTERAYLTALGQLAGAA